MKTISFELEDGEAKALEDFCAGMGLPVQTLMTLFSRQTVRDGEAPIRLSAASWEKRIKSNSAFLNEADETELTEFLEKESTFIAALVISLLDGIKAAAVTERLSEKKRNDVVQTLCRGISLSAPVIEAVAQDVRKRLVLKEAAQVRNVGGIERSADILDLFDRPTEQAVMENLEQSDSALAAALKQRLFFFEDIVRLYDRAIQKALREIDQQDIAKALKSTTAEVQEKFFSNMSKKAADMLKEDMEFMGPVFLKDVYDAQAKIMSVIKRLDECGEIIIPRETGDKIV